MSDKPMLKPMDTARAECVILRKRLPSGRNTVVHWHDYFELELIISGTVTHILNGTRHEITRGGAYLLTPNDSHSLSAESDAELINIRFNDSLLPAEISEYLQTVCRDISCELDSSSFDELLGKIGELEAEISSSGLLGTVSKSSILSQIIIKILRSADAPTPSETPHLIQKAASYVLKNFRSDISLCRTAEHCSVTPNYLGVQFKRHTGKSFNHYLNATRLKYACGLLVSTDLSVKEIAFLSGYNSVEYFLSVFEKQLHIYPTEYRRLSENYNL